MKKTVLIFIMLFMLTLSACGKKDESISYPYEHDNGKVTLVETSGNDTVIYIEVSGYAPVPVKTKITLNTSGTVTEFVVVGHMETTVPGGTVINGDFRDTLIANQTNLGSVELIAGATKTCEALIHAIETAIAHFNLLNK